jgi:hypothetical protein
MSFLLVRRKKGCLSRGVGHEKRNRSNENA